MQKSFIQHISEAIDGKSNYAEAIVELDKRLKQEYAPDQKAQRIFEKINEFYQTEKNSELYKTITPTGQQCLDKTINLISLYKLNGIRSAQFIPDDLALYHTTAVLLNENGKIIRHLEPTHPEGFQKNLFPQEPTKGEILNEEATIDTILLDKATKSTDRPYQLGTLNGIITRNPQIISAYHTRGRLFFEEEKYKRAISDFEKIVDKTDAPEAYLSIAIALEQKGKNSKKQLVKAKENAQKLLQKYPEFKEEFEKIINKANTRSYYGIEDIRRLKTELARL